MAANNPRKRAKPWRILNWRDLVIKLDKDFHKPEIAYDFPGRQFENTDKKGGPYHNN